MMSDALWINSERLCSAAEHWCEIGRLCKVDRVATPLNLVACLATETLEVDLQLLGMEALHGFSALSRIA